jgi:PknH-like extracellular domain
VTKSVSKVAAVAMFALVSACTSQVGGTPTRHVVPGTVQASLLSVDEVSTVVGTALTSGDRASEPPPPLAADPVPCAVAVGPATQSVYVRGWTAFWSETFQDVHGDNTVTQVLGIYSDSGQAGKVFGALTDGVKGCTSAVRTDADQSTSKWTYVVDTADSGALAWTATQDAGDGWACYRQARLKGKAVLQVAVCGAGDGKPASAKIADQFAGRVEG